jgi:hypothetical protein
MKRALGLFDELGHVVQAEPRPNLAQIAGLKLEGWPLSGDAPARQPGAQRLVDNFLEGPAGAARFRLQLGGHVVIESEGRSHVLMLGGRRHDVNAHGDGIVGQSE